MMNNKGFKNKILAVLVLFLFIGSISMPVISAEYNTNNVLKINEFRNSSFTGFVDLLQKIIDFIINLFSSEQEDIDQNEDVDYDDETDTEEDEQDQQTDEGDGEEQEETDDEEETDDDGEDEGEEDEDIVEPPNITVVKMVKKQNDNQYTNEIDAGKNEIVNFSITLTNNDYCSYKLIVRDELPDGLVYNNNATVDGIYESPDIDGNNYTWILFLDILETSVITFEAKTTTCGVFTNLVNITDFFHCEEIFLEDVAVVNVLCGTPNISVEKTVQPSVVDYGDDAVWNITVENNGSVPLFDVVVEDSLYGTLDEILFLDVGEKRFYEYTTIPEADTTNYVNVVGFDETGNKVTDKDKAYVKVIYPCAPEVWVDDDWSENDIPGDLIWGYTAYDNIQDAVDGVCICGTIHVNAGYYYGQILINKSLEILAEPDAKIYATNLDEFTIDDGSETYKPIFFAFAGSLIGNNVVTSGNIGVKIDGFEIYSGNIEGIIAIMYHNVQTMCIPCVISNNEIFDPYTAIVINGCSTDTTIIYNKISYPRQTNDRTGVLISSTMLDCEPLDVVINYNYFYGSECSVNIGVLNQVDTTVDARYNWWARMNGPSSPSDEDSYDSDSGRIADGFGDMVIGNVRFDPWWGVDAMGIVSHVSANMYCFDASDSFAYDETGDITGHIEYWWKFDDGSYSSNKISYHDYGDESGTFNPVLRVRVYSYDLDIDAAYLVDYMDFEIII